MKIVTITYSTAESYGALLQCYALKEFLEKNFSKIRVDVLNYAPARLVDRYHFFPTYNKECAISENIRNAAAHLLHNLYYLEQSIGLKVRMRNFMRKNIGLSEPVIRNAQDMEQLDYDLYIIGSDQVWNPQITLGIDDVFWGNFPKKRNSKIISYAASIGKESLQLENERIRTLLEKFAAVSVREKSSMTYIQKHYKGGIRQNIDPVFLLEKSCWDTLLIPPKEVGYVLLYYTEKDLELIDTAQEIAYHTGKALLCLNYSRKIKSVIASGPREMLGYIRYADCVVTNSFHGCAFSVIFQKKLFWRTHQQFGNRIDDMMKNFGITCTLNGQSGVENQVSWNYVQDKIRKGREEALCYLEQHIKDEHG